MAPSKPRGVARWWHVAPWLLLAIAGVVIPIWGTRTRDQVSVDSAKAVRSPDRPLVSEGVLPVEIQSAWEQVDNPADDGWTIEVLADRAKTVLDQWGASFFAGEAIQATLIEQQCDSDFRATRLMPRSLAVVFRDSNVQVERAKSVHEIEQDSVIEYEGTSGCVDALRELASFWSALSERRFEFKMFRVQKEADALVTHLYVAARGRSQDGAIEQHATWVVYWTLLPASNQLRVRRIEVVDFEQSTLRGADRLFADATLAALGQTDCYQAQFRYGMNYWLDRTQDLRYFSPLGNPGLAIGDVERRWARGSLRLPGSEFAESLVPSAGGRNRARRRVGMGGRLAGRIAQRLLVDLDNDGDQDLAVAILGGVVIASNEGDRFRLRDVLTTDDDTTSITAADYDLDGDLDLYVCVDYPNDFFASASEVPMQGGAANRVYHDANKAGRNSLFRNELRQAGRQAADNVAGDLAETSRSWKFVDVTDEIGLESEQPAVQLGGLLGGLRQRR